MKPGRLTAHPRNADQTSRLATLDHTPRGALRGGSSQFLYTRHRVLSASLTGARRASGQRCLSQRTRQVGRGPLRASAPFPARAALRPRGFRPGRRRAIGVGFAYSRWSGGRLRGSTASSPQVSVRKPARRTRFARERSPGAATARASHTDCKECSTARPTPPRGSRPRSRLTAGRCWRPAPLSRRSSGASAPQRQSRRAAWPSSAGSSPRERARCIGLMHPALLAVSFARRRLRWSPPADGTDLWDSR